MIQPNIQGSLKIVIQKFALLRHLFFVVIGKIHHFDGLHNAIARMAHVRLLVTEGAVLVLANADAHRLGSWRSGPWSLVILEAPMLTHLEGSETFRKPVIYRDLRPQFPLIDVFLGGIPQPGGWDFPPPSLCLVKSEELFFRSQISHWNRLRRCWIWVDFGGLWWILVYPVDPPMVGQT